MLKRFFIKRLLPTIGNLVKLEAETKEDDTGYYLKVKLLILDEVVLHRRLYLKRNERSEIIPNQKITLKK